MERENKALTEGAKPLLNANANHIKFRVTFINSSGVMVKGYIWFRVKGQLTVHNLWFKVEG